MCGILSAIIAKGLHKMVNISILEFFVDTLFKMFVSTKVLLFIKVLQKKSSKSFNIKKFLHDIFYSELRL